MKTLTRILLYCSFILCYGCEDIMEEDISDKTITINYPRNNIQIESNVVDFQWNSINGADNYRVQVYAGGQNMVLDSLVSGSHFIYPLNPGSYSWRIRGENFAYQTSFTFPEDFVVIETDDLSNQQVLLSGPVNGMYTANTSLTFSWAEVSAADHYTFQLLNVTNGNTIIHQESEITNAFITLNNVITEDAQYLWRVKAVNNASSTEYTSRTFYVDRVAPNQPQNIAPLNNSTSNIDEEINFEWSNTNDTGIITSTVHYTIQIASDQTFSNIIHSANANIASYTYSFEAEGTYYWRVKAVDQSGNEGSFSTSYKLDIDP